jgi:3-deoxy-7-phosphoheptulonate synthase
MYQRQIDVAREIARQVAGGEDRVIGVMVESHLKGGRQDLVPGKPLAYGQSITDACIGWEESVPLLRNLAEATRKRRLVKAVDA